MDPLIVQDTPMGFHEPRKKLTSLLFTLKADFQRLGVFYLRFYKTFLQLSQTKSRSLEASDKVPGSSLKATKIDMCT
jgi:hypothetical protein